MLLVRQAGAAVTQGASGLPQPQTCKTDTLALRCFSSEGEGPGGAQGIVGVQEPELSAFLSKHHHYLGLTFPRSMAALLR